MKLQLTERRGVHRDMVTAVSWTPGNELFSVCDDRKLHRWDSGGESVGPLVGEFGHCTSMSWFPSIGKQVGDLFALAGSDGSIRLLSSKGREEKKVEAHAGAAVRVRWSHDGTALCSCGEDGEVKVWSRSGNLRSTLYQAGRPVYAVAWSPDSEAMAVGSGKQIVIKAVQAGKKQVQWVAHDGIVTALDWNIVTGRIVSASEDCTYKVWDAFSRQLFASHKQGSVITSVAWAPNGETFAVGAFNMLHLCDVAGWTHSRERPQTGSLMDIAWTADGTQLAAAGGNGTVLFAQVVGRSLEWGRYQAVLVESQKIRVQDVSGGTYEELDFPRDRVVEMALGYEHLVVATTTQCFIYGVSNWNTPTIFDMRGAVSLLALSARHFMTLDSLSGLQVWTYEGRPLSSPRFQNLRPEFLSAKSVSLAPEVVAVLDRTDGRTVRVCDVQSGRALADAALTHDCEVVEIALSQFAGAGLADRRLAFVDRNKDMWIAPVAAATGGVGRPKRKLHTQVDSFAWNDSSDMLVAIADGRIITWLYPNGIYVDKDLNAAACIIRDGSEFGPSPQVKAFYADKVAVRKADGALLSACVSLYPPMLYDYIQNDKWLEVVRLCRFVKSDQLWACAACMALASSRNLDVAEEALAAIKQVDKLDYVHYVKSIPSEEGRNAELALYQRRPDAAEKILLQASPPLIYRAIKMNLKLYRWGRALELAVQHRSHVDTVLAYRSRHLASLGRTEVDPRYLQYSSQVTFDWASVRAKEEKEVEDEGARGGRGGYGRK
jgi:intraflagellar transport protein 80